MGNLYVEISDSKVRIIEGKFNKNKLFVSSLKEETISSFDKENLSKTISHLINKKKKHAYILLSTSKLLSKTIEIPKLKEKDIQSLLENNISQHFTVEANNYVSSYRVLQEFKKEEQDILQLLLIAYPKEDLEIILESCRDNNLRVQFVDAYPNIIFQEYNHYKEPVAIVDAQKEKADCIILKNNNLFLHATFNPDDTDDFFSDEKTIEESILSNLEGYFNFYSSKNYGEKIKQVFLYDYPETENLKELIERKTEVFVQENQLPFKVQFKNKKSSNVNKNEYLSIFSFIKNINKKSTINLLNASFYQKKHSNNLALASVLSVIVFSMAYVIGVPFYDKLNVIKSISAYEKELALHEDIKNDLTVLGQLTNERQQKETSLKQIQSSQYNYLTLLSVVYSLLPEGVNIEQFTVKENGVISVQFSTPSTLKTSSLINSINSSEYFNEVYLETVRLDDKVENLQLQLELKKEHKSKFSLGGESNG